MSEMGPRRRRVGGRVSARHWDGFNQDDEAQRGGEHPGGLEHPIGHA